MTDALGTMTTVEAVTLLTRGELGSEELLDAQLARIDRWNGDVNAVVALDVERARERCRAADAATARGEHGGRLHGLPMTVKDNVETEGLVTTSGAPELANHIPAHSAPAARMLERAGAIIFGKTNLPIYAGDIQTFNEVYGLTRNPWNLDRTVGGSSGGSAAAVAAGFSLLELGSDIGGSVRCPAHYCGVPGIKPTWWVMSKVGFIPGPPGTQSPPDLSVAGPIGRSIADLELAMHVLTDDGVQGVTGARLPHPTPAVGDLAGCRVGLWVDDPVAPVSAELRAIYEALGRDLEAAGAIVLPDVRIPTPSERWYCLYLQLLIAEQAPGMPIDSLAFLQSIAEGVPADTTDPSLAAARGAALTHTDWLDLDERRWRIIREWETVFEQVDVMLAPPAPVAAFPHDETPIAQRSMDIDGVSYPAMQHVTWAGLATLPLLPSTVVPIAQTADGLPVGVQIIGPRWADTSTLAFGRLLEQLRGGFTPPPGYE